MPYPMTQPITVPTIELTNCHEGYGHTLDYERLYGDFHANHGPMTGSGPPLPANPDAFARRVLTWFDQHGRKDLPWKQDPSPYRVWISEIMLQQTQVVTVIPYFLRFMSRFPSLEDLARAEVDEVMAHWSGLGYYARARNLHRAARLILDQYAGRFPLQLDVVKSLPGIGRSTAGAILSLATGQCHPILDGNVKRVLTRHRAIAGWPGLNPVLDLLWQLATSLTPRDRPGDYNQAMMDLGATLCTRARPQCAICPLREDCQARLAGQIRAYPYPKPRRSLPSRATRILILANPRGEILLERRPPTGIWGGLWTLPECGLDQEAADWCQEHLGVDAMLVEKMPPRRHTFSHFDLEIWPQRLDLAREPDRLAEGDRRLWHRPGEPLSLGLPAPIRRLLRELGVVPDSAFT